MGKRVLTPEEAKAMGLDPKGPRRESSMAHQPKENLPADPDAPSAGEVALHSGLQGASFGTMDEGMGVMGAGLEGVGMGLEAVGLKEKPEVLADPLDEETRPPTALERVLAAYRKERDTERRVVAEGEKARPLTAATAEIGGGLLIPSPVKGSMARQGAASGALYGLGKGEGDLSTQALDTIEGGAAGGAAGKILGGASNWLKRGAQTHALRAAGAQKPDFTALAKASPSGDKSAEARRLGQKLLEAKDEDGKRILGWLDNPEAIAPKLAKATNQKGEAIGGHVDVMQDALKGYTSPRASFPPLPPGAPEFAPVTGRPVSMVEIGQNLMREAEEAALQPGMDKYAASLRDRAQTLLSQAEARAAKGEYASLTLPEAEQAKRGLANLIKPSAWSDMNAAPAAAATKQASRAFRTASEDAIERLVGPDEKDVFKTLKGDYKDLRMLRDIAQRGEVAEAARMPMGLTEQNSALAALSASQGLPPVDQALRAGGASLLSRLTRGRGDAFAARGMSSAAGAPMDKLLRAANASYEPTSEEDRRRLLKWLKEYVGE